MLDCIVSNAPRGLLTKSSGGSCILDRLALLLLVFRVDTISAERSALFVKELLFPQTTPTDDAFFNRNWAGACWGRWAELELPLGRSLALDAELPAKTSDRGGRRGLRP